MREFRVRRRVHLNAPIDEIFAFHADAMNLADITPPWLDFEILTPGVKMRVGALIDYRIKLKGMPMHWRTEITAWEPGVRFIDTQRRGPYRKWIHEHRFTRVSSEHGEGTIVEDDVRYDVPGGALTNKLFVRPDLNKIFDFRTRKFIELFGGHEVPVGLDRTPQRSTVATT